MQTQEGVFPVEGEAGAQERWAAFFAGFETIVLVANSDAVRIDALRSRYGEGALFVFFNKVYKVLDRPFEGACLLVARSGPAGANIVYRREVADVVALVRSPRFLGICNLRAGTSERFSAVADFAVREPVGHLDLAPVLGGFYPPSHLATSGFALAVFLAEAVPGARVVLAGFTAKRSRRWICRRGRRCRPGRRPGYETLRPTSPRTIFRARGASSSSCSTSRCGRFSCRSPGAPR